MNTRYVGPEARERQLLQAAVRQIARSRLADHTVPSLTLTALSALLFLSLLGATAAFGPVAWDHLWQGAPFPLALLAGGAIAWGLAAAGMVRAAVALTQPAGTKGLAALALLGSGALAIGPLVALLVA